MAGYYETLANDLSIRFADAGKWGLELAFDGVHCGENAKGIRNPERRIMRRKRNLKNIQIVGMFQVQSP